MRDTFTAPKLSSKDSRWIWVMVSFNIVYSVRPIRKRSYAITICSGMGYIVPIVVV